MMVIFLLSVTAALFAGGFVAIGNIIFIVFDRIKNGNPKLPDAVVRYYEKKAAEAHAD